MPGFGLLLKRKHSTLVKWEKKLKEKNICYGFMNIRTMSIRTEVLTALPRMYNIMVIYWTIYKLDTRMHRHYSIEYEMCVAAEELGNT